MGLRGMFGGGVEWQLELDGGRTEIAAGERLEGTIRFTATKAIEARAVRAALTATEEYAYDVTTRRANGDLDTDRRWDSQELWRQEAELMGAAAITPGESRAWPFQLFIPTGAPPSLESDVLRLRWKLRAWIDAGGVDPSAEQVIVVPAVADTARVADPIAAQPWVQASEDGKPYAIYVDPRPLMTGRPFSGTIDVSETFDASKTRVEIKYRVETSRAGMGGLATSVQLGGLRLDSGRTSSAKATRVLWQGALAEAGTGEGGLRRYAFSGQLAPEPTPTVALPHGVAAAYVDVVVSRRLRPDVHFTRPLTIASR